MSSITICFPLPIITDWIDKGVPSVFWISGFYFPQAFLTGSLQNYARKHKFPIDQVNFNFNMVKADWTELTEMPADGVRIYYFVLFLFYLHFFLCFFVFLSVCLFNCLTLKHELSDSLTMLNAAYQLILSLSL